MLGEDIPVITSIRYNVYERTYHDISIVFSKRYQDRVVNSKLSFLFLLLFREHSAGIM